MIDEVGARGGWTRRRSLSATGCAEERRRGESGSERFEKITFSDWDFETSQF